MDKISVIIPCYNVEKYVAECLDSVLASDLPEGMLEIVCVEDCSTDGTRKVLEDYERQHPDIIQLVLKEVNEGVSAARNTGMLYATGNYIGFVDSDDTVDCEMFRKLYEKCSEYECDMAECGYYQGDSVVRSLACEHIFREDMEDYREQFIVYVFSTVWKRLYRRSFLDDNRIEFPEGIRHEDVYYSILCYACAKSMYITPEPMYHYRDNPRGIMKNKSIEFGMERFYNMERLYEAFEMRGLLEKYRDAFACVYCRLGCLFTVDFMISDGGPGFDSISVNITMDALLKKFPDIEDNRFVNQYFSEDEKELLNMLLKWKREGVYKQV